MRSIHFWLINAIMVGIIILHYVEQLGLSGTILSTHFGLARHSIERILFLLPIGYTLIAFGPTAGIVMSAIAILIMLPRALIWSPNMLDSLFETAGIGLTAIIACLWIKARLSEAGQRQQAAVEMDVMQDQLQSHIRLARNNEIRLATLNAVSNMLSYSLELEGLLRSTIEMIMDVMEVEVVLIFSLDEDSQKLNILAYEGVSDEFAQGKDDIIVGEGLNGLVAQTGEPMIVEDASHDPRLTRDVVRREKIQAQLIVPLKAKGHIIGTISVANRRPREFIFQETELLVAIGNQIGVALENARLYQHERQIADQLKASEQRYRELFENAQDAILVHDMNGDILVANEACERLTGYTYEELIGLNVTEFLATEFLDIARDVRRKLLGGETFEQPYEQQLIRKDGTIVISMMATSLVTINEDVRGFQHIVRDVTKERQAESNLRLHIEHITKAQEEERKRIARELHDETAQQIIALSNQLDDFIHNNERISPDDISLLESWRRHIRDTLQGLRWFVRELRPPMIDDLGLLPAVKWLIDEQKQLSDMNIDLKVVGKERRLGPDTELLLFRIVQEALANVRRHAEASKVETVLKFDEGEMVITVTDDGKGFQLPKAQEDLSRLGKLGLLGIEERARLLNGRLKVQSELGMGTTMTVAVPI